MNFSEYWQKAKLPDFGKLNRDHYETLRKLARQAFNAGRKAGVDYVVGNHEKSRRTS